jgi:hypothetical protein
MDIISHVTKTDVGRSKELKTEKEIFDANDDIKDQYYKFRRFRRMARF